MATCLCAKGIFLTYCLFFSQGIQHLYWCSFDLHCDLQCFQMHFYDIKDNWLIQAYKSFVKLQIQDTRLTGISLISEWLMSLLANVVAFPTTLLCLFIHNHLHRCNNIHVGKANTDICYINSPADWYESSYCCSALHDQEEKEKRKHVNLLWDTERDESDRGRGQILR